MNFESISKADLIKKAKDYMWNGNYIPVKDLDLMCQLTACGRVEMLDFLAENGVPVNKGAYVKKPAEGKETGPLRIKRDTLGEAIQELLEHALDDKKYTEKDLEEAAQHYKDMQEEAAALDARIRGLTAISEALKSGGKVVLV